MRVADWDQRLVAVVESYSSTAFDWAESNCIDLGVDVLKACRGDDAEIPKFKKATTLKQSLSVLKSMGCETLGDAMAKHFEECGVISAQRGDIGTVANGLLVCVGVNWFGRNEDGPIFLSSAQIERAFRV
jgi:hypothetical protein